MKGSSRLKWKPKVLWALCPFWTGVTLNVLILIIQSLSYRYQASTEWQNMEIHKNRTRLHFLSYPLSDYKPNQLFWTSETGPFWICCGILEYDQEEKEDRERGKEWKRGMVLSVTAYWWEKNSHFIDRLRIFGLAQSQKMDGIVFWRNMPIF